MECTPHESSIHVPLLMQGPGFDHARMIPEIASMVDVAPTLLEAAGVKIPDSMQGRSFVPVVTSREGPKSWHNEATSGSPPPQSAGHCGPNAGPIPR